MIQDFKIELVENKGPNNMRDELRLCISRATGVDIAVAFINLQGLNLILNNITKVMSAKGSKVRILIRISRDAFNEPSALRTLLELSRDHEDRAEVRITKLAEGLHQKMYVCHDRKSSIFFIGSSNLTDKGLTSEGEINVKITSNQPNDFSNQAAENFETYWNDADKLTDELVDAYTSFYMHVHSRKMDGRGKRLWYEVSRLSRGRKPRKVSSRAEVKVWLDYVTYDVSTETEKILDEYTNWNKLSCYACGLTTFEKCSRGDILVMADHRDNNISANYVKDKTRITTPDGRYFIAYDQIHGSKRKRITRKLLSALRQDGFISKLRDLRPTSARNLTSERISYIFGMLSVKHVKAGPG